VHLVGFTIEIYYDARSYTRQISKTGCYVVNGNEFCIEIFELLSTGLNKAGNFLTY